ncbi:dTDP-glucose 4,6-dehydratase [Streptomyces sp. NPDC021093]|uniref:dTDP-glucose 4,6-dehydratase n=1 Tax=Streptomyces sp. NPDC021093 TaxID=3365112 RepID=UPI00379E13F8
MTTSRRTTSPRTSPRTSPAPVRPGAAPRTPRILVTGGAGFIGSAYVRRLLGPDGDPDARVTVLDALTYAGNPANLDPVRDSDRFTFVHGDICDAPLVDALVAEHDQIVHFAAESHVDRSILGAADFVRTNVSGTQTLLDAAHRHQESGFGTFVHISTDEVYGSIDIGSWPETDPLSPNSPYSAAKAASDLLALAHHRTHGLDVRVTRCSNNYGPYQFPEKVVPLFITRLLRGERVPLYGDGGNVRDWLHVDDHVRGIELVRTQGRPGEVYNIGGGTELTNKELTGLLLDACGADWSSVDLVEDRKGHDRRYSVDCGKLAREAGYLPRKDFAEGLAETVAWYRANPGWWEPLQQRSTLARGSVTHDGPHGEPKQAEESA